MQRSLFDKVKTSLWMLPSFFGLINGFGFIYLGRKNSNIKWTIEGIVYEIPWLIAILNIFNLSVAITAFSLGSFMVLISIVRSVMVNYEYQRLLDEEYVVRPSVESGSHGLDKQIKNGQFNEKEASTKEEKVKYNPYDLSGIDKNYDGRIKFDKYKAEIKEMEKEFNEKNDNVKELVEKRFSQSGITYDRFMFIIKDSEDLFNSQAANALDMIDLAPEYTETIDAEIRKKMETLRTIIEKNDELRDELIINMTTETGSEMEIKNLFEDMRHLTSSIKHYE